MKNTNVKAQMYFGLCNSGGKNRTTSTQLFNELKYFSFEIKHHSWNKETRGKRHKWTTFAHACISERFLRIQESFGVKQNACNLRVYTKCHQYTFVEQIYCINEDIIKEFALSFKNSL
jgi:hypothetical protein